MTAATLCAIPAEAEETICASSTFKSCAIYAPVFSLKSAISKKCSPPKRCAANTDSDTFDTPKIVIRPEALITSFNPSFSKLIVIYLTSNDGFHRDDFLLYCTSIPIRICHFFFRVLKGEYCNIRIKTNSQFTFSF